VTSDGASFGFFSPLAINGLHARLTGGGADVRIQEIATEKPWPMLLWEKANLGAITFVRPNVEVIVDKLPGPPTAAASGSLPRQQAAPSLPGLTAVIEDATVQVRSTSLALPALDLDHLNVTLRLQQDEDGNLIVVEPVTIFNRQKLTPEICRSGMQLVAPLLASQIDLQGEFTFQLEKFQLPLLAHGQQTSMADMDIAGVVKLHGAAISVKDSIARSIVRIIDRFLVLPIPDQMNVVEDSIVKFHVADGRVHHQGLAMILPHGGRSIELQSSGSVGLDGSLDLQIEIKLPGTMAEGSELARLIGTGPFVLLASGTLDKPVLKPRLQDQWPESLSQMLLSDDVLERASELMGRTRDTLGDLLNRRRENDQQLVPRIRDRMQNRRQRRRGEREDRNRQ
jgi:hypothetical protein